MYIPSLSNVQMLHIQNEAQWSMPSSHEAGCVLIPLLLQDPSVKKAGPLHVRKPPQRKSAKKEPPPRGGGGGFLFCCFWLFGQANGKITIKFRIAFGCLGSESHAPRRSSMNLMEIMAIGQWDHCKPWMINNQLWPRKDGWRRWGTYMDLWGIIPTAYGDLNVGDEALHH